MALNAENCKNSSIFNFFGYHYDNERNTQRTSPTVKRFQCVVLDKKWQTRNGTLEAADTDHARQKVFEMGFSIVQIKEIPIDDSTPPDSLIHPELKRPDLAPPVNQASSPESPAPEEPGDQNTQTSKKRPGVLMP